ncbi:conserved hypothetical protein [Aspergillus terreus NIH2624]|uniref:Calponin-homology (CH) domain-containing protein n=1 Tax=Aspergillus terreus (strain NIH 2624 / FGSC A1156) TaxID=341663 RepID=Q0CSX7_ASPTN|nr:uncharacterized protein ATEG_03207 [Aspergillus terreus NIH2624]EAU36481.1 conserved hypothetical protein [Aspergillus terreus NIH2624]
MASVTSLDKDLRSLRLSRYTPQAAAEVRDWIEDVLQEKLPSGDLLEALKDGVALCRLVNLAVSPGVKYKVSSMPFVQMENISHFLRACQTAPLSLPPHDVFLTVDLYEAKDPAQVLQCLMAFSRRANALQPSKFRRAIGVQSKTGTLSPNMTGSSGYGARTPTTKPRGLSNVSDTSGRSSPAKSPTAVSTWSKKTDEYTTAPAWNIHQYGYMGGASQANQGVAFGARRQITTAAPHVPSLAEKEKRRREEEERQRREQQEAELHRQRQREEEEARARAEEERIWEEETARLREKERREVEEERKRWDAEQRRWEEEEQQRLREEKEAEERLEKERLRRREINDSRLNGQFLSQYQATQESAESQESQRIRELERELELAKVREAEYQRERQSLREQKSGSTESRSPRPTPVPPKPSYSLSSLETERRLLRGEWQKHQDDGPSVESASSPPPPLPSRPLPDPTASAQAPATTSDNLPPTSPRPLPERPLPDPTLQAQKFQKPESRVDRFLSSNRPPVAPKPATHRPADYSSTAEIDAENNRRAAAQQKTRAGGWASKSLLEREMERERERQREWEENQKQTQEVAARGLGDKSLGSGPGQAWDVHQYGFMGGDNQNRGGPGLGVGGARRQIIGPRPPP